MQRLVVACVMVIVGATSALAQTRPWEQIRPKANSTVCLSVAAGGSYLAPCNASKPEQLFRIVPRLENTMWIANDGGCLSHSRSRSGPTIVSCASYGAGGPLWKFNEDGSVRTSTGECLDVAGGNYTNVGRVIIYGCHGGDNQKWIRTKPGNGARADVSQPTVGELSVRVQIRSESTSKCIDNPPGSNKLILYQCHGGDNQRFYFQPGPRGTLINVGRLCITAPQRLGEPVTLEKCRDEYTQGWLVNERHPTQLVRFYKDRTVDQQCLGIAGQGTPEGPRIVLASCKNGYGEKFGLVAR